LLTILKAPKSKQAEIEIRKCRREFASREK